MPERHILGWQLLDSHTPSTELFDIFRRKCIIIYNLTTVAFINMPSNSYTAAWRWQRRRVQVLPCSVWQSVSVSCDCDNRLLQTGRLKSRINLLSHSSGDRIWKERVGRATVSPGPLSALGAPGIHCLVATSFHLCLRGHIAIFSLSSPLCIFLFRITMIPLTATQDG